MYYALTAKGLDRVEQGLPERKSDYFEVLGAISDLEITDPLNPHTTALIMEIMEMPKGSSIHSALKSLANNGLIEEIQKGDDRFPDFK